MTIHITPENEYSYVSFESNVAASSYNDLITRVIETFQPGKFVVTVFANKVIFFVCLINVYWYIFTLFFFCFVYRHLQHLLQLVNLSIQIQFVIGNVVTFSIVAWKVTT